MTRRRKILLAVPALILLALGGLLLWPDREPKYDGKPVSFWFRQYYLVNEGNDSAYSSDQLDGVLRNLGTNALPYLIKQALSTERDTAFRTNFYELLGKLPDSWHLPPFVSYDDIRSEAVDAIGEINPSGAIILPFVKDALGGTNDPQHKAALKILGNVHDGKEILVPNFAKALQDPDPEIRAGAIDWLAELGPPAKAAVPELIQVLTDRSDTNGLTLEATTALGSIGPDAAAAIPALKAEFSQSSNLDERLQFAAALCEIESHQTNALNFLIEGLKSENQPAQMRPYKVQPVVPATQLSNFNPVPLARPNLAESAAGYLGQIGSNAAPAIPALVAALDSTNVDLTIAATQALHSIGATNDSFVPKLEEKLTTGDEMERLAIARTILQIAPGNRAAEASLIELAKGRTLRRTLAMYALAELAPDAKDAIPLLRELAKSTDVYTRNAALAALEVIDGKDPKK